jgi:hypothetical protein
VLKTTLSFLSGDAEPSLMVGGNGVRMRLVSPARHVAVERIMGTVISRDVRGALDRCAGLKAAA